MHSEYSFARRRAEPQTSGSGASQFDLHTVLIALRCWTHLALPIGLLMAGGAAVVMYYITPPAYTASTWLLIRERPVILVQNAFMDDPRKFVENQIELLRSPPVLEPVAADPGVATTPE